MLRIVAACVVALSCALCVETASAKLARPVVFLPGILGSHLCDGTKVLWPSVFVNRLALAYTADATPNPGNIIPCGVLLDTPAILPPFKTDQYGALVEHLTKLAGPDAKQLLIFAYDWRLSADTNAKLLAAAIQKQFGSQKIAIVAHSLGGIVARYYINDAQLNGRAHVAQLILMGSPLLGSADTLDMMFNGLSPDNGLVNAAGNNLNGGLKKVRETALSFPSLYDLLPTYKNCCNWHSSKGSDKAFSAYAVEDWARFSWFKDIFSDAARRTFLTAALTRARSIRKTVDGPTGVDTLYIVSRQFHTHSRIFLASDDGTFLRFAESAGDGTVIANSATEAKDVSTIVGHWTNRQHSTIFASPEIFDQIDSVLVGGTMPTGRTDRSIMVSLNGHPFEVQRIGTSIEPNYAKPGEAVLVRLTLFVKDDTDVLALPSQSPRAHIAGDPATELSAGAADRDVENGLRILRFSGSISAPTKLGGFDIEIALPDGSEVHEFGFVLGQ